MIRWHEFGTPDAASDRGWLLAPCEPYDPRVNYTHDTLPVYQDDWECWREQSSLGSYLDYGTDHYRSAESRETQPGNIHCIAYNPIRCHYFETVADAKAWLEQQARESRPDVALEVAP